MNTSEWAAWVQGVGSVVAIFVAVLYPIWQDRKRRIGHLETVATDLRIAARQAEVYLKPKAVALPAYQIPLYGPKQAVPALLADGTLAAEDATNIVQFYVDATSFNWSLDLGQQLHNEDKNWHLEVGRIKQKASHLISTKPGNRYDLARQVLLKHVPRKALERLEIVDDSDN